jgi:hypothetical protein
MRSGQLVELVFENVATFWSRRATTALIDWLKTPTPTPTRAASFIPPTCGGKNNTVDPGFSIGRNLVAVGGAIGGSDCDGGDGDAGRSSSHSHNPPLPSNHLETRHIVLLFPGPNSVVLGTSEDLVAIAAGRLDLVVVDATWKFAREMVKQCPFLSQLPRRSLPLGDDVASTDSKKESTCFELRSAFALLGIANTCTAASAMKAYRQKAHMFFPDRNPEKVHALSSAYACVREFLATKSQSTTATTNIDATHGEGYGGGVCTGIKRPGSNPTVRSVYIGRKQPDDARSGRSTFEACVDAVLLLEPTLESERSKLMRPLLTLAEQVRGFAADNAVHRLDRPGYIPGLLSAPSMTPTTCTTVTPTYGDLRPLPTAACTKCEPK